MKSWPEISMELLFSLSDILSRPLGGAWRSLRGILNCGGIKATLEGGGGVCEEGRPLTARGVTVWSWESGPDAEEPKATSSLPDRDFSGIIFLGGSGE